MSHPGIQDNHAIPPVAIVGMAMRLPGGVKTDDEFWDLLMKGKDGHCRLPESRFNADSHCSGEKPQQGYFLQDDPACFDAGFFKMPAQAAAALDPRQRLLLEIIWECMENAGHVKELDRKVGCYVGAFGNDWLELAAQDTQDFSYNRPASTLSFALANRVSHEFNLTGPSVTYETACSSSMTALHDACQALYSGECTAAVVAGVNLIFSPTTSKTLLDYRAISADGICRTFDAKATGYGRGEAVNAILIKRLDHALQDGDAVRAVIRATAVNADGKQEVHGAPRAKAQEELIRRAYTKAHIEDFSQTAFFECHGTGTQKGDKAEVTTIGNVFPNGVMIGAVKPNVGHSEGASGITSLIKAVLMLERKLAPPNAHLKELNPRIPFESRQIQVPLEQTSFPDDRAERVSVNSFGIGGSNAHVIMESSSSYIEKPDPAVNEVTQGQKLLVTSANDAESLEARTQGIQHFLHNNVQSLHDLAYTTGARRQHLSHRAFKVTNSKSAADIVEFEKLAQGGAFSALTFVFTGQGAQWTGMGKELIAQLPSFRKDICRMDDILQQLDKPPQWKIEDELSKVDNPQIDNPELAQTLCTAVQIGLANILSSWGVRPDSVVGHSSGEIAAAYAAGAIPITTAVMLSYYRGQVTKLQNIPGAMAAVGLGKAAVQDYLRDGVVIACDNSPENTTLSGSPEALDHVLQQISTEQPDIPCKRLRVSIAYHSYHMREIGAAYEELIKHHLLRNDSMIPMYSSITCNVVTSPEDLDVTYWRRTLDSQVCFYSAINTLVDNTTEDRVFAEIGSHSTLSAPLRHIFQACSGSPRLDYVPSLVRDQNPVTSLLSMAGQLYLRHIPVDLLEINGRGRVLTNTPLYPWRHDRRYWHETRKAKEWRSRKFRHHPLLGVRTLESTDQEPSWRNLLQAKHVGWLLDHKIGDDILFPCVGYISMAGEATRQISGQNCYSIRKLYMSSPLQLQENGATEIITSLRPVKLTVSLDSLWYDFTISSYDGKHWRKHCSGQVRAGKEDRMDHSTTPLRSFVRQVNSDGWYRVLQSRGLDFGPEFCKLQNITADPVRREAAATARSERLLAAGHYNNIHPVVIDQGLQLLSVAASNGLSRRMLGSGIPVAIDRIYVAPVGDDDIVFNAGFPTTPTGQLSSTSGGDVLGVSSDGQVALVLEGAKFFSLDHGPVSSDIDIPLGSRIEWKPDIDFLRPKEFVVKSIPRTSAMVVLAKSTLLGIVEITERLGSFPGTLGSMMQFQSRMDANFSRIQETVQLFLPEAGSWNFDAITFRSSILREAKGLIASAPSEFRPMRSFLSQYLDLIEDRTSLIDFLMDDTGFKAFYELIANYVDLGSVLSLLGHANPTQKLLEIKSNTCGATAGTLTSLYSAEGARLFKKYTLAAKFPESLAESHERFKDVEGFECGTLDPGQIPVDQGFEAASYDLIIVPNDLPLNMDTDTALRNLRSLLVPGGRLLIREVTPDYALSLIPGAGMLTNGDEHKNPHPFEFWDAKLHDAGYVETGLGSCLFNVYPWSMKQSIFSRVPYQCDAKNTVHIVCNSETHQWTQSVARLLHKEGYTINYSPLEEPLPSGEGDVIYLLDLDGPYLQNLSKKRYEALLGHISQRRRSLWVTKATQITCDDPSYGMILGLARTIRYEESIEFATFEVEHFNLQAAKSLVKVYEKTQRQSLQGQSNSEFEYAMHKDVVHVGRFHWQSLDNGIQPALENDAPRTLEIRKPGAQDPVAWSPKSLLSLDGEDVDVEVHFVGLNFRDIMVSSGFIGDEHGLGLEASGIVRQVGQRVTHLRPGDRVHVIGTGLLTTRVVTPSRFCFPIAGDMSLEDAATIPIAYATAIYSLLTVGQLEKGQSVLIHSACGAVGQAAIRICEMMHAQIYTTVGNEQKVQYLMETFGIPRSNIFHSRDASFASDVMRETDGNGVDIVLNSLSGALLHESWNCVAKFGKMIEIGKRDFMGCGQLSMETFASNRSFFGVDLLQLLLESPQRFQRLGQLFYRLNRGGHLKPINPIRIFPVSKADQALATMQRGTHIGKIVIKVRGGDRSDPVPMKKPKPRFAPEAAYLLVGGLGGLGRAVSNWMVENGARNLVIVSRSGVKSRADRNFIEELRYQGCNAVVVVGNVADINDVNKVIAESPKAISGVIHLGMVLKPAPLFKALHDDWVAVHSPKVEGAWNLHHALSDAKLDFFVVFSSIASLCGIVGQASYASANSFLDAFVNYRRSLGLPAVTLNLGAVGDIGCFTRTPKVLEAARASSTRIIEEAEVLEALQLAIHRSRPSIATELPPPQVIAGMSLTRPQADPSTRPLWSQDARYLLYSNIEHTEHESRFSLVDEAREFFTRAKQNPAMLKEEHAQVILLKLIGRQFKRGESEEVDLSQVASMTVDSLALIEMIGGLRRNFNLELSINDISSGGNFGELVRVILQALETTYNSTQAGTSK